MTTPKAKLAGLALIAALCAGFTLGLTAPAWAGMKAACGLLLLRIPSHVLSQRPKNRFRVSHRLRVEHVILESSRHQKTIHDLQRDLRQITQLVRRDSCLLESF